MIEEKHVLVSKEEKQHMKTKALEMDFDFMVRGKETLFLVPFMKKTNFINNIKDVVGVEKDEIRKEKVTVRYV